MRIEVLKSKIHTVRVTHADLHYEGSIDIDEELMDASGLREFEKVLIANFTNGNRYETYVIKAPGGSRRIAVNGGGARYSCIGDTLTIFAFAWIDAGKILKPKIILCDEKNNFKKKALNPEKKAVKVS